jgi:hypothetical protein
MKIIVEGENSKYYDSGIKIVPYGIKRNVGL